MSGTALKGRDNPAGECPQTPRHLACPLPMTGSGGVLLLSLGLCTGASRHVGRGTGSCGDVDTLVQGCSASSHLVIQLYHPGGELGHGTKIVRLESSTKHKAGAVVAGLGMFPAPSLELLHLQRGFTTCCPRFHCSWALAQGPLKGAEGKKGCCQEGFGSPDDWDDLQARQKDLVRRMVLFCTLRSGSTFSRAQPLLYTAERNALGSSWELRRERYFFRGEMLSAAPLQISSKEQVLMPVSSREAVLLKQQLAFFPRNLASPPGLLLPATFRF